MYVGDFELSLFFTITLVSKAFKFPRVKRDSNFIPLKYRREAEVRIKNEREAEASLAATRRPFCKTLLTSLGYNVPAYPLLSPSSCH